MQNFVYHTPTEIVFGENAEDKTASLVRKYGGSRVFIVYGGKSAQRSGLLEKIEKLLEDDGISVKSMGGVVPNPVLSTAREMIWSALDFKADFILAIGGGSVIDTAKAIAHGVANPDVNIWDFWLKKLDVEKSIPIGAILTISAAGSETSDSSVITNDTIDNPTKRGINTPFNRCCFAVMDPILTMTLPRYQIGAGAADIFMHTAERYFTNVLGNHLTDEIAEGLFRDIIKYGQIGVDDPQNYEAMSEIMWCGSVSHVGLTGLGAKGNTKREGDWACHQLGMALSAVYNYTHGATLTAVWGTWATYVMDENLSRFAQFARNVFGVTEDDDRKAAEKGIVMTNEFFAKLGMPLTISELMGHMPSEDELKNLAFECSYGKTRTIGSFKELDYDDILKIYTLACS